MRKTFKNLMKLRDKEIRELDQINYRNSVLQADIDRNQDSISKIEVDLRRIHERVGKEVVDAQVCLQTLVLPTSDLVIF